MRVFLLTSFPTLDFDSPAPLGFEEVFTRCADHLSESDLQELEGVCSRPPEGSSSFAHQWQRVWETIQAKNKTERLAKIPSMAQEKEISPSHHPDSQLRSDLEVAWAETDPLKRETALLKSEWNWLESKRRLSPFSLDDLFGYALQLRLLERKDSWEEAAGETQFTTHVRSFIDPVLEDLAPQEAHA